MSNTTNVEAVKSEIARNPMLYVMFFLMMGGQTGDIFTSNNVANEVRELRQDMERRMLDEEDATVQFEEDIEYLQDEIDDLWDEIEDIREHIEQIKEQL
jgi:peptidoglycan hydrolase CwlO-like protein